MPLHGVPRRFKRARRRLGAAAPVVVTRRWPWYVMLSPVALIALLAFVAGQWHGGRPADTESVDPPLMQALHDELARLKALEGVDNRAVDIEKATQQHLLERVRGLEKENGRLKEELLVLERLLAEGSASGLQIEALSLLPALQGRYGYRLLVANNQQAAGDAAFKGRFELEIDYRLQGEMRHLVLPGKAAAPGEALLEIRRFARRSGEFSLPEGAELVGAEARVWQGTTVRARRSVKW